MNKSIKKLTLLSLGISLFTAIGCKREVSPELEITVFDTLGVAVNNAKVRINVDGANNGLLIPRAIDSSRTDAFGKAYFEFDNTILLDVQVLNGNVVADSASVLCEVKRLKRNEDNIFERTLTFR